MKFEKYHGYKVFPNGNIISKYGNLLSRQFRNDGYVQVKINGNYELEHRILATCFIDNPENKEQVNHINGTKSDNRICNLEWSTASENVKHAFKTGLSKPKRGKQNGNSKLNKNNVLKIKNMLNNGVTHLKISKKFGVSRSTITNINNDKTWEWIKIKGED